MGYYWLIKVIIKIMQVFMKNTSQKIYLKINLLKINDKYPHKIFYIKKKH